MTKFDINEIDKELEDATKLDATISEIQQKIQDLLPEDRKVWEIYGWNNHIGKLIGIAKTLYLNPDIARGKNWKYAGLINRSAGSLPFIGRDGKIVPAVEPQYEVLQKALYWTMCQYGLGEEIIPSLETITSQQWETMVSYAMKRLAKHKEEAVALEELNAALPDNLL
jgi:hypothetical protein